MDLMFLLAAVLTVVMLDVLAWLAGFDSREDFVDPAWMGSGALH
ncbi:MAG TPA: hypothetical protein VKY74_01615 [Chloroflexia bacterium]|nr:hypothetical protein [Chloroflexia bacterium]